MIEPIKLLEDTVLQATEQGHAIGVLVKDRREVPATYVDAEQLVDMIVVKLADAIVTALALHFEAKKAKL